MIELVFSVVCLKDKNKHKTQEQKNPIRVSDTTKIIRLEKKIIKRITCLIRKIVCLIKNYCSITTSNS